MNAPMAARRDDWMRNVAGRTMRPPPALLRLLIELYHSSVRYHSLSG
jgi:hypothetical protein